MYIYANLLGKWTKIAPEDEIDGLKATVFYDKFSSEKNIKEFYLIKIHNAPKGTPHQYLVHKSCIQLI